jgi:hypothetical protein
LIPYRNGIPFRKNLSRLFSEIVGLSGIKAGGTLKKPGKKELQVSANPKTAFCQEDNIS